MLGCVEPYYNSITAGSGTYIGLCEAHYMNETKEEKIVVSITSEECLQVLKEWNRWISSYYSLIGPQPQLIEIMNKTTDIIARGEMK